MRRFLLFCSFIWFVMPTFAEEIYKCLKPDGTIYYQDKFCNLASHIQTEVSCYNVPSNNNEDKRLQNELKQYRKLILKKRKQRQKKKAIAARSYKLQQKRRIQQEKRCAKINQKIQQVTQRQRTGYNVVQGIAIDRKLADYKTQRRKYCTNEQ